LPDSPRWLLAHGRVEEAVAAFEQFGVRVLDYSQLATVPAGPVAPGAIGTRVRGWLAPYARLFSAPRRAAVVFAILMIGLIPLNGIGQSVLTAPVLHQFGGHLSKVASILASGVIWIGALAGSYLAWRTLDRIGRTWSIVGVLVGFVVVYVLMVTVAIGTPWLIPLFCLLGVVTWWGASACWPLPSELAPTELRGRAQGLGTGLQRVSIGVNVLLVSHMLVWVWFRATVLVAAGLSVVFIPLALWGRRFEPTRKSLEVASADELFAVSTVTSPDPGTVLSP
jgi:putative MFS transporter